MSEFYVYILFRLDGTPCYVGQGKGRRFLSHQRPASARKHNPSLAALIEAAGTSFLPAVKIREGLTREEAVALEIELIAVIGREVDGGPLVNIGPGGWLVSEATRKKMSSVPKNDLQREKCRQMGLSARGRKISPEHAAKLLASVLGRKAPPEELIRRSEARKGEKRSLEARAKMSEAGKRRVHLPHTEEAKEKMRLIALAREAKKREARRA